MGLASIAPAPRLRASRKARSGSSTSSGGRALSWASAWVATMSSGALAGVIARTLHTPQPPARCGVLTIMPKTKALLSLPLACLLLALAGAGLAQASHSETVYFEDSAQLLNPKTRPAALATIQHLGAKALRVELYWREVAPNATSATKAGVRCDEPRELPLGTVRSAAGRSPASGPEGAAHRHLAGAALGNLDAPRLPHPARCERLRTVHDGGGARVRLAGVDVGDLERAEPPRVSAAAVRLQWPAGLAAHLSRAVPGGLQRAARGGHRPAEGADGRNGAHGL